MTSRSIPETLSDAALMLALLGARQEILWANQSFKLAFSAAGRTDGTLVSREIFPDEALRWIRSIESSGSRMLVTLGSEQRPPQELSITVLDLSSNDPDSELRLIALSSQIPRSEELAQREEYLMTIAHDLKNPIGAIFGYADVLLDTKIGAGLDPRQRDILFRIRSTASRAIDLVRNYQHLGVIEQRLLQKELTLNVAPVDIVQICKVVIESTWREECSDKSLKLFLSDSPLLIRAERSDLERIVSNLLGNAIKFTPAGGEITMRCALSAAIIQLSIHNSGSYIPAAEQQAVFEAYGRGSNIGETAGSGLGLYIVKKIVTLLRGQIELESSEQVGTTFTVKLPLAV